MIKVTILFLSIFVMAQQLAPVQTPTPAPPEITTKYLPFEDHTLVQLKELDVIQSESIINLSLSMGAAYSYAGREQVMVPNLMHLVFTSTSPRHLFLRETSIKVIADGKRFTLGPLEKSNSVVTGDRSVYVRESLIIGMPTATLREIANSKSVAMQASIHVFKLEERHLRGLLALIARAEKK